VVDVAVLWRCNIGVVCWGARWGVFRCLGMVVDVAAASTSPHGGVRGQRGTRTVRAAAAAAGFDHHADSTIE